MVLSNKKLKLKLRAESALNQNNVDNSLTTLASSATLRTTLPKREKRRKLRSLNPPEASAEDEGSKKGNGSEDLSIKKKNKKRKRKVTEENDINKTQINGGEVAEAIGLTSQENGDVANDVNNDANKSKNKTKKKKKKSKKKKAKNPEGEVTESTELTKIKNNGEEVAEKTESATELTKTSTTTATRQEIGDVPTKVYVGGIPYYSTEDDIRSYFESCGTITEVDCMYFPETGKFRGIAIISFKTEAAAKRALALDGADMGGLFLKIQPYKSARASKAPDFAPEILEGYNRIYVGNLSWDITEEELRKFFTNCNITSIRFGMDKETGEFQGYGHVDFSDSESLKTALTLDQKVLFGRPVRISCAVPLKKKSGTNTSSVATSNPISGANTGFVATSNPKSESNTSSVATSNGLDAEKSSSTTSGKMKRRKCYECGEKGHLLSECPKNKTVASTTT